MAGTAKCSSRLFLFQNLRKFPVTNMCNVFIPGKTSLAERKMLSLESVCLSKKAKRREIIMKNNNQINVPQAREAMDRFKMQAASEVGVNLTNGYNGHLTSREAGSVGGQMVKKMIEAYEQGMQ